MVLSIGSTIKTVVRPQKRINKPANKTAAYLAGTNARTCVDEGTRKATETTKCVDENGKLGHEIKLVRTNEE